MLLLVVRPSGLTTEQVPALGIFCEEEHHELHRRQARIAKRDRRKLREYPGPHAVGRAGFDNTLMSWRAGGRAGAPAAAHHRKTAAALGARLIVFDNIAHGFAGNENDRHQVTAFVSAWTGIAQRLDRAVVLIGHPGEVDHRRRGGVQRNTAWEAAVRSRIWLERPKADDGDDPEYVILRRRKANYAPGIAELELVNVWAALLPAPDAAQAERATADRVAAAREAILDTLQRLDAMGIHLPLLARGELRPQGGA